MLAEAWISVAATAAGRGFGCRSRVMNSETAIENATDRKPQKSCEAGVEAFSTSRFLTIAFTRKISIEHSPMRTSSREFRSVCRNCM